MNFDEYNKQKSDNYKSKYSKDDDSSNHYNYFKNYYKNKKKTKWNEPFINSPSKTEFDPDENKLRRYELLKSILENYKRQIDEIKRWERSNNQNHSNRKIVENEIEAVERRINQMKKDYSYEKLNYDFIELNLVDIQNRINIIKNDLGIKNRKL